jgi:hypothetical protein
MAIEDEGMDRREFLRKAAIAGSVAWAVPVIQTVAATPAYASHSPTIVCEHSPQEDQDEICDADPCHCSGDNCVSTCQCKCPDCRTGGDCNAECNDIFNMGVGPAGACDPNCWDCATCSYTCS